MNTFRSEVSSDIRISDILRELKAKSNLSHRLEQFHFDLLFEAALDTSEGRLVVAIIEKMLKREPKPPRGTRKGM